MMPRKKKSQDRELGRNTIGFPAVRNSRSFTYQTVILRKLGIFSQPFQNAMHGAIWSFGRISNKALLSEKLTMIKVDAAAQRPSVWC